MTYRIKSWDAVFENRRSRELDAVKYVCWPTNQDSEGFCILSRTAEGTIALGVFGALVQWASKAPARGTLADERGDMTPSRYSLRYGLPLVTVEAAWTLLIQVGWLEECPITECRSTADAAPTERRPSADAAPTTRRSSAEGLERNGTDGRERKGTDRNGTDAHCSPDVQPPTHDANQSKGKLSSLPSVRPSRTELDGVLSLPDALTALRIDGEAAEALANAEGLDVPTLREIVAQIDAQPGVRNPKRLLVSVLCQRFGITLTKTKKHSIGGDVRNIVAEIERIRTAKIGAKS